MGACLSVEENHPPKVTRRNQKSTRPRNERKPSRVPSSTLRKNNASQRVTSTKQNHLSKNSQANGDLDRIKSTPTRRSTSKPNTVQATKEAPVLREVNRGSDIQQSSTHDIFQDSKEKLPRDTSQKVTTSQPHYYKHDPKPVETSSFAAPWASGSLVQQRMSQLFQSHSVRIDQEQERENVSWEGLVKQRQSIFQNNNLSCKETEQVKDNKFKETNGTIQDSSAIVKSSSMKENATPLIESSNHSIELLKRAADATTERKQRTETPIQLYPNDSQRLPRKKLEDTSSELFGNESMDMEKWRNRRTRRMARNSVLMDEQGDPEEAAARSMRGSVLRAHSSMKFQF